MEGGNGRGRGSLLKILSIFCRMHPQLTCLNSILIYLSTSHVIHKFLFMILRKWLIFLLNGFKMLQKRF